MGKHPVSKRGRKVEYVKYVVANNGLDSDDLVRLLEITPEDILDRFEDRLSEHHDKFIPDGYMVEVEDYDTEEETDSNFTESPEDY